MHERPDPESARTTLEAFVARAARPNIFGGDLDALGEQARESAEVLDDHDAVETAVRREQHVDVGGLPAVDVDELAAELGVDSRE